MEEGKRTSYLIRAAMMVATGVALLVIAYLLFTMTGGGG